jgi:hypothetical protein
MSIGFCPELLVDAHLLLQLFAESLAPEKKDESPPEFAGTHVIPG